MPFFDLTGRHAEVHLDRIAGGRDLPGHHPRVRGLLPHHPEPGTDSIKLSLLLKLEINQTLEFFPFS
jgi:hypothetical protein